MNVLLTGANGLLGRCVARELEQQGIEYTPLGHTNLPEGMRGVDLTNQQEVLDVVGSEEFTHIINCAANRDPESCKSNPTWAYAINGAAVENLAIAANLNYTTLFHISTDYVFSGDIPPYREEDPPNPINTYGRSKLAGEYAALSAREHLIIRIPALYRTDLSDQANVTTKFAELIRSGKNLELDSECARYYTLADEVAKGIIFLLNNEIKGIIHLSAGELLTKAEFARHIARNINEDEAKIIDSVFYDESDSRPLNSHLDTEYYQSLGGPIFTPASEALEELKGK